MGQFRTTADIADEVLQKCGEPRNGSSQFEARVITYLNKVQQALVGGGNIFSLEVDDVFPWARARYPMVIELLPAFVDGTLSVVAGDINVNFSSQPNFSMQGWFLQLDHTERRTVYRIMGHEAGSDAAIIDSAMLDDSGTYAFRCFKLEYELIPAYLYIDSKNDKLDFCEVAGTQITATLTHGAYTPATLLAHVLARLNAATQNGIAYTGSYDSVLRKFTLTSSLAGGKIFSLLGATGTNRRRSALPLLGYDQLDQSGSGSYTSTYVTNGISRLIEPFRIFSSSNNDGKITGTDMTHLDDEAPIEFASERIPTKFSKISHENDGTVTVRFNGYPKYVTKVIIPWVPIPIDLQDNDASIPVVPRQDIDALIHGACAWIQFDKEDSKFDASIKFVDSQLTAMRKKYRAEQFRIGENYGQISPRSQGEAGAWLHRFRYGYETRPGSGQASPQAANTMLTKQLTFLDFRANSLVQTVVARTLPANRSMQALIIKHSVPFAGGAITQLLLDVGIAGDPTKFINGFDVMQAVGPNVQDSSLVIYFPAVQSQIQVRATAVGANLDQLTQGVVDLHFQESVIV